MLLDGVEVESESQRNLRHNRSAIFPCAGKAPSLQPLRQDGHDGRRESRRLVRSAWVVCKYLCSRASSFTCRASPAPDGPTSDHSLTSPRPFIPASVLYINIFLRNDLIATWRTQRLSRQASVPRRDLQYKHPAPSPSARREDSPASYLWDGAKTCPFDWIALRLCASNSPRPSACCYELGIL